MVSQLLPIPSPKLCTKNRQKPAIADPNGLDYLYTAKKKNVSLTGDKITIEVNDIPGNEALKTETL